MALRNASTATPEAIQKLAETNLYLLAKNKKQEARIQRLREALDQTKENIGNEGKKYTIQRIREALATDLEGGKDE